MFKETEQFIHFNIDTINQSKGAFVCAYQILPQCVMTGSKS